MLQWTAYPFIRITSAWIIGILMGTQWFMNGNTVLLLILSLFVIFLTILLFLPKGRFYQWYSVNGIVFLILLMLAGMYRSSTFDQSHHSYNLKNFDKVEYYKGIVTGPVQETSKFNKSQLRVDMVRDNGQWKKATGKILIYLPKKISVQYGNELLIQGRPLEIPPASNPYEFDYRIYLKQQNIFHQHFIRGTDGILVADVNENNRLYAWILKVRELASRLIKTHIQGKQEQAVALALILGIKDELDNELKSAYGVAGAMHVLAVSGLHVGIVYGFLFLIFGHVRKGSLGRALFMLINLTALWTYAGLTGFSPSALRATIMISAIVISQTFNRQNSIYNSIFFSAFIILIFDPFMLFSVGFQLSYLAVLGIVYLTPKIYRSVNVEYWLFDKMWMLTSVSLAAQIATLPVTIYYFHQAPVYFWAINIMVIPAAFIILISGISLLCLGGWEWLGSLIGKLVESVIWGMNKAVFTVEGIPGSAIYPMKISSAQVLLLYCFLLAVLVFFHCRKFSFLSLGFICLAIFVVIGLDRSMENARQSKIVFYDIPGHTAIDFVEARKSHLYTDPDLMADKDLIKFSILPFHVTHNLDCANFHGLPLAIKEVHEKLDIIVFKGKTLVYIKGDLDRFQPESRIRTDYLIIGRNAVRDMKIVDNIFEAGVIIVDGANARWLSASLYKQSLELGLNCISLADRGAQVIEL